MKYKVEMNIDLTIYTYASVIQEAFDKVIEDLIDEFVNESKLISALTINKISIEPVEGENNGWNNKKKNKSRKNNNRRGLEYKRTNSH